MKVFRKKGQGSAEFIIIASAMLFILISMTLIIQSRMGDAYKSRLYVSMEELGNVVNTEIRLASAAKGDYIRKFYLPPDVDGHNYTMVIYNYKEIAIRSEDVDYIIFFNKNVSGTIEKGWNLINKTGDNITVTHIP